MKSFKELFESDLLTETLLTFGPKQRPEFNTVVIMAGGAGSGKGFVKDKLVGIEGKSFDVDALKEMALKSNLFKNKVKEEFGYDISEFDLKNPDNVSKLHEIVDQLKLSSNQQETLFKSIMASDPRRKPNLIFDVTMKSITKLESITRNVKELGYKPEDINIVWVLDKVEKAVEKNKTRERVVREDILIDTHRGVSYAISTLIKNQNIQNYMNGDFYIVFNQVGVDSLIQIHKKTGGFYIDKSVYVKLKDYNKPMKSLSDISDEFIQKIKEYVPDAAVWDDKSNEYVAERAIK